MGGILWNKTVNRKKMHKRKRNEVRVLKIIRARKKKRDNFILLFELLVF